MKPTADVALITMPFGPLQCPSIALGLLKPALELQGISTRVFYFNLAFARQIGTNRYDQIAETVPARTDLVGEWLFNGHLFDRDQIDVDGYIRDVLQGGSPHHIPKRSRVTALSREWLDQLLEVRRQTAPFLASCLAQVVQARPRVVGFTSIFQEHVPSLSLARLIKKEAPDTVVVLGGSNCEGPMGIETVRQFPFVDAAVNGEGDLVFPDLVRCVLDHRSIDDLPGVCTQKNCGALTTSRGGFPTAPPVRDMDALPFPDYDDYFAQSEALGVELDSLGGPHVMFETARGCWWGQIQHCTFCGLNGLTMAFRSKSPSRALEEIVFLVNKFPGCPIQVSDNILDLNYLKTFLPELAARHLPVSVFYEVKANLKRSQVKMLRDAGVDRIQPGIESFSSPILRLMRKGVSGIQNIQLLKSCKELGVRCAWGLLSGFPGEDPSEYARMARLIPLITHLAPPIAERVTKIRLDRFSPNHYHAQEYGFTDVAPFPAYGYVYPISAEALDNLAYFFTYHYRNEQDVAGYTKPLDEAIGTWRRAHPDSDLFFVDKDDTLLIWDLRPIADTPLHVLTGLRRVLYLACEEASGLSRLREVVRKSMGQECSEGDLQEDLGLMVDRGLMVREGSLYLGLAVRLGEYVPNPDVLRRFLDTIGKLGRNEDGIVSIAAAPRPSVQEGARAT